MMRPSCLLMIFAAVCGALPTRPLNERSTADLAWQAWLLVDQSRDPALLRKRITPKSVFIAPTFSPQQLPKCAHGYVSDAMNRCVKIIKIDEAAHFDFLLTKLNDQFADYDEEDEEMAMAAVEPAGPFQVSLPLGTKEEYNTSDVALILTPRSPLPGEAYDAAVKGEGGGADDGGRRFSVENVAEMLGVRPEDIETTTIEHLAVAQTEPTADAATATTDQAAAAAAVEGELASPTDRPSPTTTTTTMMYTTNAIPTSTIYDDNNEEAAMMTTAMAMAETTQLQQRQWAIVAAEEHQGPSFKWPTV